MRNQVVLTYVSERTASSKNNLRMHSNDEGTILYPFSNSNENNMWHTTGLGDLSKKTPL